MKRGIIAALLLLASLGLFAQADTWYFSVLPGYQFSSSEVDTGWVASFDGGYYFTDNVGIHGGFMFNEGNFKVDVPPYGTAKFDDMFEIAEVGVELVGKAGEKGQIYGQFNVGYAFGLSLDSATIAGMTVSLGDISVDDAFCYGAAFGYRHFFNDKTALNLQATYHRVTGDWDTNHIDLRIGVSWKF